MGVNSSSKKYIEEFEIYLKSEKNFSSNTVRAYIGDVFTFLIWADNLNVDEIDTKKFSEYLYFIQKINYTKTTVARKMPQSGRFTNFYIRKK